jgi:hypothetical protein
MRPARQTHKEDNVAKGQQRSNREKKKPKQDKKKMSPAAPSSAAIAPRGKPLGSGSSKKGR